MIAAQIAFFLSGFAGLIYEVVWTRRLVLIVGGTVHAVSLVLGTLMGGFAIGSLLGAALARRTRSPWRTYGWLEIAVAGSAAAFPYLLKLILSLMESGALSSPAAQVAAVAALLPPAILMGATFPVISQSRAQGDALAETSKLYSANLFGACAGTLTCAFLLIPLVGLRGAEAAGVLLNLAAAGLALGLPAKKTKALAAEPSSSLKSGMAIDPVCAAGIFISGFCGMAFQVIWTRLFIPGFRNSIYGFASIVFVFLLGLAVGSALARVKKAERPVLGLLIFLSGLYGLVGYASFELTQLVQIKFFELKVGLEQPMILLPLLSALLAVGPVAILQGMALPLVVGLAREKHVATALGRLYFANTLGAILGSAVAGFFLIPSLNVQKALLCVIALSLSSGALLFWLTSPKTALRWAVPATALAAIAGSLVWPGRRHIPFDLLFERKNLRFLVDIPFYREDAESAVAVLRSQYGLVLAINGMGVTGIYNETKMMAHIPMLLHPQPKRSLIICFGMGTTFRSALAHQGSVEVVELVPTVPALFPRFYPGEKTINPRGRIIIDDGRHHLLTTREPYDVIMVDPSPPLFAAGTVNLYNRDFFELMRRRLSGDGLAAVWLPGAAESEFKMVLKSFLVAFPHTQLWRASKESDGVLMLGSPSPIVQNKKDIIARLRQAPVAKDLVEINKDFKGPASFFSLYLGEGESYRAYVEGTPELTDDSPWIEYPFFRSGTPAYKARPPIAAVRS